jgi:hypothetical protein
MYSRRMVLATSGIRYFCEMNRRNPSHLRVADALSIACWNVCAESGPQRTAGRPTLFLRPDPLEGRARTRMTHSLLEER